MKSVYVEYELLNTKYISLIDVQYAAILIVTAEHVGKYRLLLGISMVINTEVTWYIHG